MKKKEIIILRKEYKEKIKHLEKLHYQANRLVNHYIDHPTMSHQLMDIRDSIQRDIINLKMDIPINNCDSCSKTVYYPISKITYIFNKNKYINTAIWCFDCYSKYKNSAIFKILNIEKID